MSFDKLLLIPIEKRKTIVVGKSGTSGVANYLTAANGSVISMGIPEDWADYIVEHVNDSDSISSKAEQGTQMIYSLVIPRECPGEWKGQEVEIDTYGNIKKKFNFRFSTMLQAVRKNIKEYRKFKKAGVKFPYYGHVHCIVKAYVTEDNGGTLPRFCAVIEKLLIEMRVLIRSTSDPCIRSFDGSRMYIVQKGEERIEIVLREYKE